MVGQLGTFPALQHANSKTDVPKAQSLYTCAPGENNSHSIQNNSRAGPPFLITFSSLSDFSRIFEWL